MVQSTVTIPSNSKLVSLFRGYSRGASAIGILVGASVLVGWLFDIPFLKNVLPGLVTMKVNTALCFILTGVGLRLLENEASPSRLRHLAQALATIVSLIGLFTLSEYLSGWDLGIDQLLIEEPAGVVIASLPGRMAPITAVSFVLIGFALLLLDIETSGGSSPTEFLALTTAAISCFSFAGYLFGIDFFYGIGPYAAVAIHTPGTFIALCAGILLARPDSRWMAMITRAGPGGVMARRLLPAAVAIPLLLGWLRLKGELAGLYGFEFGLALFATMNVSIFVVLVWWNAGLLNQKDMERSGAEQALRASEQTLAALFEYSPDGIVIVDQQGRIKRVNRLMETLFGYKRMEFINLPIEILVPERFKDRHIRHRENYRMQPRSRPMGAGMELSGRRKDGSEFPLDIMLSHVETSQGTFVNAFIRDVSERRQAEQANRQRVQDMQSLHEIGQSIINSVDLQTVLDNILEKALALGVFDIGVIRLLDATGKSLTAASSRGYREPKTIKPLSTDAQDPAVGSAQAEVFESRGAYIVENVPTSRKFSTFKAEGVESAIVVPVRTEAEILGTIQLGSRTPRKFKPEELHLFETIGHQLGIALQKIRLFEETSRRADDLTLKTMELERANRTKDEFLAMMSHELRTPLNVLMGYTGLLREGMFGALNPQQENALEKVAIQSNDLLGIVMNLLRATEITGGEIKAERARTDLGQLLGELKNRYELLKKNELTLKWEFPSDLPPVETDGEKLRHILVNLIDNAIRFTPNGSVWITAHHLSKTKTLRFTIADSGLGIAKESLPNIFDMFRQADGSDTRAHGGLGLGLYLAKNFVELLGGKIKVKSALGRGSVFTVTLPYESNPFCGSILPAVTPESSITNPWRIKS